MVLYFEGIEQIKRIAEIWGIELNPVQNGGQLKLSSRKNLTGWILNIIGVHTC